VTSRLENGARRKNAHDRRIEIVASASAIALADGLSSLTLRRVAAELGVFPGLVNHYFPSVDELVAAAFGHAASAELAEIFAGLDTGPALERLQHFLATVTGEHRDGVSLLWLDAWQGSRHRPALRAEVVRQMLAWRQRLGGLLAEGARSREFRVPDAGSAADRILAVIDGLSIQAAVRSSIDYGVVRALVWSTAERELGLAAGALRAGDERPGPVRSAP
jgi:AcrR family transcriptional regulator